MITSYKLPLTFNPQALKSDMEKIEPGEWIPHFNTSYFRGEWSGVALRSVGGLEGKLYPDPTAQGSYADTNILSRCENIRAALATFECQMESVRFLKLTPGSEIREHRDYNLGIEDGEVRFHIPVVTNPLVEFYLQGEKIEMSEGECWYLNFNLKHRVANRGATDRVHLVVDCVMNGWLRSLFPNLENS
ncbi:MAG TPA: aspartyl/asparaginyl beta-hydroxylase domain-containing protein [Pyrinomonadaceae bacterium]|nr:aspartyl/asparaginyl beta-hydroxylase domain-containing protein [Pyrinomonadaceae bacterium]